MRALPNESLAARRQLQAGYDRRPGIFPQAIAQRGRLPHPFRPPTRERIWTRTQGRDWLTNALCSRACFRSERDRYCPVTEDDIRAAQGIAAPRCRWGENRRRRPNRAGAGCGRGGEVPRNMDDLGQELRGRSKGLPERRAR